MSETPTPRLKVSREGIVLIKSFEGFRPRAVQDEDGRWIIGYGHTASAREGLTVAEADAELLLQYDLMPVVKALNEQVHSALNQHQFDALASFAVSVGVACEVSIAVLVHAVARQVDGVRVRRGIGIVTIVDTRRESVCVCVGARRLGVALRARVGAPDYVLEHRDG